MKKTLWAVGGIIVIAVVLFLIFRNGDVSQAPTGPALTSMSNGDSTVAVSDKEVGGNSVVVDLVILANPGFVVIHEDAGGNPGTVIGRSGLLVGTHNDVSVALDRSVGAGDVLHAMLHRDDGDGVYEFPGPDTPLVDQQDNVLEVAFNINGDTPTASQGSASESQGKEADQQSQSGQVEIIYTDAGFSPGEITISRGETVVFKNQSSSSFWPATAQHPTHTVYPGSDIEKCGTAEAAQIFDACQGIEPDGTYSLTFDEAGTWGYHNHLRASHFGRITVE